MLESLFVRLAGFKTCNFLERGPQHRCFPVNIAKYLRTLILMKVFEQLFLQCLLLTVNISSWVLVSALNSIGLLQRSSSRFKEFSLGCLVVGSSLIWKKEKLVEMVTRCHSLSLIVPFVVIPCHSLSLFVICCHWLSLVVIRCHSLYHSLSLIVNPCTTRLSFYKRSFFTYLFFNWIREHPLEEHRWQFKIEKISYSKVWR